MHVQFDVDVGWRWRVNRNGVGNSNRWGRIHREGTSKWAT